MGIEEELFSRKAKGINSDRKGKRNEVALAKALGKWVGSTFHRVPASGGLAWTGTVNTVGDLICDDATFPFTIETKHYRSIGLKTKTKSLRSNSIIYKFWQQAKTEGKAASKIPLLIVRENNMTAGTWWVFCDAEIMTKLEALGLEPKLTSDQFIYGYLSEDFFKIDYKTLCSKKQ